MLDTRGTPVTQAQTQPEIDDFQLTATVLTSVADILQEIVNENSNQEPYDPNAQIDEETKNLLCQYNNKTKPQVTIQRYLSRIVKYANPEPSSIIMCLIYIDKLCECTNIQLTYLNVHRLILSCIVLAIKFNEDDYYSNEVYAKIGGISLDELNKLEGNTLILLDFNASIDSYLYSNYENQLREYDS